MQQEIREILESAATEPLPVGDVAPLGLVTVHTTDVDTAWGRTEIYGDDGR
jgi:hypothetical protein